MVVEAKQWALPYDHGEPAAGQQGYFAAEGVPEYGARVVRIVATLGPEELEALAELDSERAAHANLNDGQDIDDDEGGEDD